MTGGAVGHGLPDPSTLVHEAQQQAYDMQEGLMMAGGAGSGQAKARGRPRKVPVAETPQQQMQQPGVISSVNP